MERRCDLGETGGEDEPREIVDSEKQREGIGWEGVRGWESLVLGIKEGTYYMKH